jgi:hypothetical protein
MTHSFPDEASLFAQALEKPPQERPAFLDDACHGNLELRERIEALLHEYTNASSFLEEPAAGPTS